jgi:hypothetical protein
MNATTEAHCDLGPEDHAANRFPQIPFPHAVKTETSRRGLACTDGQGRSRDECETR